MCIVPAIISNQEKKKVGAALRSSAFQTISSLMKVTSMFLTVKLLIVTARDKMQS